jgi:hypothetical protein
LAQVSIEPLCKNRITIKIDSASGVETLAAQDLINIQDDGGKTKLSIYCFLNSSRKVVIFSVQAVGAGKCVDKGDKVTILFQDGQELDLSNTNDFNCDGSSTIYFGGSLGRHNELNLLATRKIRTMRVWTRDDYVQKDIPDQQATAIMETIKCLSSAMIKK